uniref:Uncharacterized protein n=1 Tax=Tetradesmus obliquus TaxID=3088 RepID=A0A383WCV2_TETOB|eukprot:jgi/Sobl393_1/11362/SZX70205.1
MIGGSMLDLGSSSYSAWGGTVEDELAALKQGMLGPGKAGGLWLRCLRGGRTRLTWSWRSCARRRASEAAAVVSRTGMTGRRLAV